LKSLVFQLSSVAQRVAPRVPYWVVPPDVRMADGDEMKRFNIALSIAIIVAAAAPGMAQQPASKDSAKRFAVPADARPPKGMCRVWIDGVPAAQQPAATDCPTAVKNRPSNGRVIFGDDYADSTKSKTTDRAKLPPGVKGFTGVKPPPQILQKRPPG
jgi:hypothetical protein